MSGPTYAAAVDVFSTDNILDSLAASSTLLAGMESNVITCTWNDIQVAGRFKLNNTTPTAGLIQVYAGALLDDSEYPDVFDGTEGAETITSVAIRDSCLVQIASITTPATANQVQPFRKKGIAWLFGGRLPPKIFFFVTHSTVQALNATTGAGGQMWYTPITD